MQRTDFALWLFCFVIGGLAYVGLLVMMMEGVGHWASYVTFFASSVTGADLALRIWLSEERIAYFKGHRWDLLYVAFPTLRGYRDPRAEPPEWFMSPRVVAFMRPGGALVTIQSAYFIIMFSAFLVLLFESGSGGEINDFWTALWWSVGTVATVGYGDVVPVSTGGRIIAGLMMPLGIGVFAFVIVRLGEWFTSREPGMSNREQLGEIRADLKVLQRQLIRLEAESKGSSSDRESPDDERP